MNSTVIKSESDREQFKRDLVKQKIRENFCSIKETFKKYKCRDIEEVLKKGKKEDLSLKERQKLQRFANFFYIEAWKDGKYENLQISKLFCKELEEIMELKVKNIFNSKKLISSLSSFKNRSERGENEMEEEEGFKEIKDSESLSEHLKNVLMPDFIEGIKNKYHLDDIIEIIEGVDVPKSTLPGQPETTKFGSILSKLKINPSALWKANILDEDFLFFIFSNENMCLYAGSTCILNTKNLPELLHTALSLKMETMYPVEPNLEFLLSFFARKVGIKACRFFKKNKKYSSLLCG